MPFARFRPPMHPAYFETLFHVAAPVPVWPEAFVILSAHATTGETWTDEQNRAADRALEQALRGRDPVPWIHRIVGYHPATGHAEPSWAVSLGFDEACDLGTAFRQDALYHVEGDLLTVSRCGADRRRVPVGPFRERLVPRSGEYPQAEPG